MKKIILTEQQAKKLMNKVVNEQVPAMRATEYSMNDGRYHIKCEFDFEFGYEGFIRYKNGEIETIDSANADVSFLIDIDHETYGIKGISITDIRGPKEIKTIIEYYPEGSSSDDEDWWEKKIKENIIIPLNWKKLEVDDWARGMNYFGLNKRIKVHIRPNENGGLVGEKIEATIRNFNETNDED